MPTDGDIPTFAPPGVVEEKGTENDTNATEKSVGIQTDTLTPNQISVGTQTEASLYK